MDAARAHSRSDLPPAVAAIIPQIIQWAHARSIQAYPLPNVISLNNTNYQVIVDDQQYVMRVASETPHWLGVRRAEERAAALAAAQAGVWPPILYADEFGNLVTSFIQGRQWEAYEFHEPANRLRLVQALRRLHAVRDAPANGSVFRRIEHLIRSATTLGVALPDGLDRHLTALARIEAQRAGDTRFRPGLCHNDCWANNFIDDGTQIWMVDWEFGGDGDGLFDLATLTLSGRSTEQQQLAFLNDYGYTEPDDLGQLHSMIYVVWCFEALWALVQHGLRGSNDYDYQSHAQRMFQRMQDQIDTI